IKGKYNKAVVHTEMIEPEAHNQIQRLCNQEFVKDEKIIVMPDVHAGKGCVIGLTMTTKNEKIVPNLIGVDIGCGVLAVELTGIKSIDYEALDYFIKKYIPSGYERHTKLHFRELTEEEKAKKPFSAAEVKALILIGLVFLAFFTRDWHGICFSIVVMAGTAIAIFLGLIDWKKLHQRTEWAVCFLVFGGGISLGMQMGASGAAEYLAGVFFPFFEGKGWLLLVIAVGVFASLITNLMANVAAAALILPIAIPLALMEGVDPTLVALTLGMWTSFAYLLVIGCPPNVVAYSFGYFKPHDLARAGLVAMPIAWIAMIITAVVWWEIIGLV
ncbi:anion permease, partial [Peptococcaceae bacterium]|nr:anion permease [Peptococcaceae bacterium]